MIRMPFEEIIDRIMEKSQLQKSDVLLRIEKKCEQLSGLISKEGAAHIVANELGIKLFQTSGRVKIKDILPGMRDVEAVGKVQQVYEVREFQTQSRQGKVGSLLLADETASIRAVLWGSQTDLLTSIKQDTIIKIKGAYVKDNMSRTELHLNDKSKLIISPPGESIGEVMRVSPQEAARAHERKKISELAEGQVVELLGTVVQIFDIRFFEVCPECGKRARPVEDSFECTNHGKVSPAYSYVMNLFLDDGTENIRAVFFRSQIEQLTGKSSSTILSFREDPSGFEQVKHDLLGQIIKVAGRVTKNQMFDRLEFIANAVDSSPNPEEELKRIGDPENRTA